MKNDVLKLIAQKAKRRLIGKETYSLPKIKIIPNEDINFKSRVEFLLAQEDVVTNPVHYLVDETELKHLNEEQKERYLLATLDKYARLKAEIESLQMSHKNVM